MKSLFLREGKSKPGANELLKAAKEQQLPSMPEYHQDTNLSTILSIFGSVCHWKCRLPYTHTASYS